MKYLLLALCILPGCATISEYNRGCREGVKTFIEEKLKTGTTEDWIAIGCDNLELRRTEQQRLERELSHDK